MPEPVTPASIGVPNLAQFLDEIGIGASPVHANTYEFSLYDGLSVDVHEDATLDDPPSFVSVCAAVLTAASATIRETYRAEIKSTSNTVDPDTGRSRTVILHTPSILITAVRCTAASGNGVPCHPDCSPKRRSS